MAERKDWTDGLYRQYLTVLDERDDAEHRAELWEEAGKEAFTTGFLTGMAVLGIIVMILSIFLQLF